ncbi:Hvo_1808 family surface protein [Halorussus gelatinilyticus]|uniref:Hvo_1808 family surface protein n=1 Tax=Halorussus gelatinilyticus TaxID=2937524 RepID=A0A8U0INU4_9EURY|nr:Hvo_1808 family surface protein [Halorussus gelatinilyticus]UPW02132.1 Hvo_1808 family surface protein [Halorussus gelatinilyticus]
MRTILAIAVVLMLVVAGCSQAPGAGTTTGMDGTTTAPTTQPNSGSDTTGQQDAVVKPEDPATDTLGWESGLWYNETIDVEPDDGLNETELNKTVSRSMARVERIRKLEFEERVPVHIMTREEFRANQSSSGTSEARRVFDNAKYESLFMINESTDSLGVQNSNSGSSVGGYYDPTNKEIVVISENESTPQLDEITLSQELFHALQDQKFNFSSFNQTTRELHNAKDGVIEGDGNYVDYLYSQRCQNQWNGDCLTPEAPSGSSGSGGLANIGPYLIKYQPYSDGPAFVKQIKKRGGWQAVNDLYENPPKSTEQVIHPEKYGKDSPAEFSIENRASDGWERVTFPNRPNYASVGEAGMMSMFMYPFYASNQQTQIVPARDFFNRQQGSSQLDPIDPLNYNSTYSNGWDGDKLAVYTNDAAKDNETGYVWKSVWDSEQDAEEFVTGYRKVLKYNGAEKVDGRTNTWRIPSGNEFSDAFYVKRTGDTVVVVNAPSVSELSNVRKGAAPAA